jgi:hypothetical protein
MSRPLIDHPLLDLYEKVKGELEALPETDAADPELWEIVDQLLLDLHMIRHGYASEGYERFVERRLKEVCADEGVVGRLKGIRL